jgi:uncharacterized protein YcbX
VGETDNKSALRSHVVGQYVVVSWQDGLRRSSVRVWRSTVDAAVADETVNDNLSNFLQRTVKLILMDDEASSVLSSPPIRR